MTHPPASSLVYDLARSGRILAVAALLGALAGGAVAATRPVRFSATSTFLMSGMAIGGQGVRRMPVVAEEMRAHLDGSLLRKAEARLSLPDGALEGSAEVTPVSESGLYRVSVSTLDPDRARNAANVVSDLLVERLNDLRQRRVQLALDRQGTDEEDTGYMSAESHLLSEVGSGRLEQAEAAWNKGGNPEASARLAAIRERISELRMGYERALAESQTKHEARLRTEAQAYIAEPAARGFEPAGSAQALPRTLGRSAAAGAAVGGCLTAAFLALLGMPRRAAAGDPEPSPS